MGSDYDPGICIVTQPAAHSLQRGLPRPSPEAIAHSARLQSAIEQEITAAGGWIPFSRYMQLALYEPGLGYYSAGATKFGDDGDFVTAPMISPLFSRVCARQIGSLLRTSGTSEVLEFGPGTGDFAAEALTLLGAEGSPLTRYSMLEVSADLRDRQQHKIRTGVDIAWLSRLPENFSGVIFANEILDAMPCERFVVRGGEWWRLGVGLRDANSFEWRVRPADGACADDEAFSLATEVRRKEISDLGVELPEGYCGEWQVDLPAWFAAISASLVEGAVLIADYGLPRKQLLHPDRVGGSLRCHYRHRAHGDPFLLPGLCDITAWVDFTSVAEAATTNGFDVSGFTTQASFLIGAGIEAAFHEATAGLDPSDPQAISLARGLQTLLLPGEMGESVKFMLLSRKSKNPVVEESMNRQLETATAFSQRDLRDSL